MADRARVAASIATTYRYANVALLNWELLPEARRHPSHRSRQYCYHLGYVSIGQGSVYYGTGTTSGSAPILQLEQIREAEETLRREANLPDVTLMTCKPIAGI